MKKMMMTLVGAALATTTAFAADVEDSHKATVDKSKNPLTGTQTTTKKYNKKVKAADGSAQNVEVTDKTKVTTDGEVKRETEIESESQKK